MTDYKKPIRTKAIWCASLNKIPPAYLDSFLKEGAKHLKSRLILTICVFLATFIGGSAMGDLLIFGKIVSEALLTWGLLTLTCGLIYLLVKRVSDIFMVRLCAIFFIFMILNITLGLHISVSSPPWTPLLTYIIILFAVTFTIPWMTGDIIWLSLLHTGVFSVYFFNVSSYRFRNMLFKSDISDYMQGIILLTITSLICYIVTRSENERRTENFLLLKNIKNKNQQMQGELEVATRVHNRLIPHSANTFLADIAATYIPAYYMGGDYAKFNIINNNKLMFIICDVTGHGVSAALVVNAINTEYQQLIREKIGPGRLMKEMDKFIESDFADSGLYLSAFCGLLDFSIKKFTYSNYGHPPQYISRSSDYHMEKMPAHTTFLGLNPDDDTIYESEMDFSEGDQIVLFTDGVIEAKNNKGEEFGADKLEELIKRNLHLPVEDFNKQLINELHYFTDLDNEFKDDVLILNIRIKQIKHVPFSPTDENIYNNISRIDT